MKAYLSILSLSTFSFSLAGLKPKLLLDDYDFSLVILEYVIHSSSKRIVNIVADGNTVLYKICPILMARKVQSWS